MNHQAKTGSKRKRGRPTKATPKLIQAILKDLARGFSRLEACERNGCSHTAFQDWEKREEYPALRARARAARKEALLRKVEESKDWNSAKWLLERNFPEEFGKEPTQIFAQQNNYTLSDEKAREIDARVERLRLEMSAEIQGDKQTNGHGMLNGSDQQQHLN